MSRAAGRPAKFVLTRVLTAAGATAIFIALWAAVAATGSSGKEASGAAWEEESAPIEQDGWRWDAATGQWVAIEQPAPIAEAPEQVVVIERQPVYYYVRYVVEAPAAPTVANSAVSKPAAAATTTASGTAAVGAPAGAPAAAPTAANPAAPGMADASLPPAAPAPAAAPAAPAPAPAAPAPAPAPAPPPVVAAKPPPPAPAPAAPRKTKGS